jgi:hypothetical protein
VSATGAQNAVALLSCMLPLEIHESSYLSQLGAQDAVLLLPAREAPPHGQQLRSPAETRHPSVAQTMKSLSCILYLCNCFSYLSTTGAQDAVLLLPARGPQLRSPAETHQPEVVAITKLMLLSCISMSLISYLSSTGAQVSAFLLPSPDIAVT